MKLAARAALAIVVLLAGFILLPRPVSRVVAPDAYGQLQTLDPTKLPDEIIKSPSPSPTPTKTKTPKPPEPPDPTKEPPPPGGGEGPGGGGDGNTPKKPTTPGPGPKGPGKGSTKGIGNKKGNKGDNENGGGPGSSSGSAGGYSGKYSIAGEFNTDKLQLIATQLRARGVSEDQIMKRVYAPFIIAGPAAWTDTWGAPRYGPGPIVRTHEGQDVFCKFGDPVLASMPGTIEFDDGGLGGRVARLHVRGGSYWYYAHLAGWNTKEFSNGDTVETGDVIGYCGNTGNAITTPPHVHFGWYQPSGESRNPMAMLVKWLRTAERNAGAAYEKETGRTLEDLEEEQSRRLFGDGFAPDISELKVSSEALLAASSSPGAGAFGLAEAALQAALAAQVEDAGYDPNAFEAEGAGHSEHSELAELLQSGSTASPTENASD
ncbi:MAG: M23 family metallopeptidase [Actinomycetota bacterium]|nr:M23 family metallopeptidase [Actinomycetota bacterium]